MVAVSGGVDSMVLIDLVRNISGVRPVVAHFDHGIRGDSELDRKFVHDYCLRYKLAFVFDEADLGPSASEDKARQARYRFLQRVRDITGAKAIVTAHHQDDLIETALLNLLRGTGRKGLTSLKEDDDLKRPLLGFSKRQIIKYAKTNNIDWREDPTNTDTAYRRNHVRHNLVSKLTDRQRKQLLAVLDETQATNKELDLEIANFLQFIEIRNQLDRDIFISLPHKIALEILAEWLRSHNIRQFDKKLLEKIVLAAKTLKTGKRIDVDVNHQISIEGEGLKLNKRQR